jgi:hypothetical protein
MLTQHQQKRYEQVKRMLDFWLKKLDKCTCISHLPAKDCLIHIPVWNPPLKECELHKDAKCVDFCGCYLEYNLKCKRIGREVHPLIADRIIDLKEELAEFEIIKQQQKDLNNIKRLSEHA